MVLGLLLVLLSFMLGSIPTALLVGKYWKKIDIRKYGSGNIGTTNVFRILGPVPALIVLLGDMAKGSAAVYIGLKTGGDASEWWGVIAGLGAIAGHTWSPFVSFKGGKGVATGAGILLALVPLQTLILALLWLSVVKLTRYVSLASISAAAALPVLLWLFHSPKPILIFGIIAGILVILRHIPNIKRLWLGSEYKIGEKVEVDK